MDRRTRIVALLKGLGRYVRNCVAIDTRTLAVFRIAVGVLIIADLLLRARRFSYFYTEDGVVPRWLAQDRAPDNAFSFFFFTTDPAVTAGLFALHGLIAVQLILGYKTRIATILSFLFIVSLDHRNLLVTSYADTLFRLLVFWSIFLPLGARWSIDAIHAARPPVRQVANLASAAILVQMIYMYVVNGYHKWDGGRWSDGEAVIMVFGLDDMTFLLGDALRNVPTLLQYGGILWYYMLLASPLLLLLPGRLRWPLVVLFLGGHASFAITVRIGAFAFVAIAGVLLFLQWQFWEDTKLLARRLRVDTYIDRTAALVEGWGHAAARWLPALQVRAERPRRLMIATANVTLVVAIVAVLMLPALHLVADTRVAGVDLGDVDRRNRAYTAILGVNQPPWTVFAPNPRRIDRWHVFVAQTADGELLDVYNDRTLSFERPGQQLQRQYETYRERFYMNSVRRASFHGDATPILAEYLCRTWLKERGVELTHLNFYAIFETVTVDTVDRPEERKTETELFYIHGCGGNDEERIPLPEYVTGAVP